MGIFDKLLKAIGFEDENSEIVEESTEKKKKEKPVEYSAKFDLKKEVKNQEQEEDVIVCAPKTQKDVEVIVSSIKDGRDVMVNLGSFMDEDCTRALDFLSGAIFAIDGNIKKIEKHIYLLETKK